MAEISKIQRAVEMPPVKKEAFANLIKTCNGAVTKNGDLFLSKKSTTLNSDIERELKKCSNIDSGLANAIMLIFGRPNLDYAVSRAELIDKKAGREALFAFDMFHDNRFKDDINKFINEIDDLDKDEPDFWKKIHLLMNEESRDYANVFLQVPKETASTINEGSLKELRAMLNEEKISEAIALSEELLESDDLPGVKGLLLKGVDDIKSNLQAFRSVWQKYQEYAEPAGENGERVSRSEMESRLTYNEDRIVRLTEQIEMEQDKMARLIGHKARLQEENAGIKELLGGETREKVEEVVGADVLQFPQRAGKSPAIPEGAEIAPGEHLVADMVSGRDAVTAIKRKTDEKDNVVPLRKGEKKDIPDDIA